LIEGENRASKQRHQTKRCRRRRHGCGKESRWAEAVENSEERDRTAAIGREKSSLDQNQADVIQRDPAARLLMEPRHLTRANVAEVEKSGSFVRQLL